MFTKYGYHALFKKTFSSDNLIKHKIKNKLNVSTVILSRFIFPQRHYFILSLFMLQKSMFETEGNMEYHLKYFLENDEQRYSETRLPVDSLPLALKYSSGKVTKFPVEKLSTSEVISQNLMAGGKHPPPPPHPLLRAFRVQSERKQKEATLRPRGSAPYDSIQM